MKVFFFCLCVAAYVGAESFFNVRFYFSCPCAGTNISLSFFFNMAGLAVQTTSCCEIIKFHQKKVNSHDLGGVSLLTVPLTGYGNGKNSLVLKTAIRTALSMLNVNCCF